MKDYLSMSPEELEAEKQAARERMNNFNKERELYYAMEDILLSEGEAGFDNPEYDRLSRQFHKIADRRNEDFDKRYEAGEIE